MSTNIPLYWNPETQQYESVEGKDGAIKVSGGADGAELATEGTLAAVKDNTAALAGTLTSGQPAGNDSKIAVGIATSVTLPVEVVGGQAVSALPEAGAEGFATYPIGLAPAIPVGEADRANPVVVLGTASITGEVSQGRGASPDTGDPWIVATSDGVTAQQIATKAGQDAALTELEEKATTTDVQAVEAAVSSLETSLADHATLTEQQTQTGHLSTIATEVTGVAKDASVQAVELELQDKATEATAQAIEDDVDGLEAGQATGNASLAAIESDVDASRIAEQSIDAKTLTPLGTDFATPVRGTATNSATQLPSSSTPRGFALENIDSANDLYVGTDNTVTTANGFKISPSRSRRFNLGNPNTLWVISATTTAWQIGAVV